MFKIIDSKKPINHYSRFLNGKVTARFNALTALAEQFEKYLEKMS